MEPSAVRDVGSGTDVQRNKLYVETWFYWTAAGSLVTQEPMEYSAIPL